MNEILTLPKVFIAVFAGIISVVAWLVRRELSRNKEWMEKTDKKVGELSDKDGYHEKMLASHDKSIAVMEEAKIGRTELKEEIDKIQKGFETQFTSLKEDMKEDTSEIKDMIREIMRERY